MARSGYTQRKVADKTGLSGATISQYLKGVYNGNIDNVEGTLRDFLTVRQSAPTGGTLR
ncbi:MAG: helix-turn-helix domain-containing protein [Sodalis sp. (in: enterobacteria)]|uniref:helix-turn-helix domain-containing protein n=1 Tax=Sodalis sp. (in: enterobacteria) TaxID=1898979 RepID=UPI003F3A8266